MPSLLIDETSYTKISHVSKFIGATYAGLGPDYRVVLKKARKDFQKFKLQYNDDQMPVHSLAREVANLMQEYTQSGGVRPFGVSMFMAGHDRDGNHLYQVDPSGAFYGNPKII